MELVVGRNCTTCLRTYARTATQQLPSFRIKPRAPFTIVGADFAGPLQLRRGNPHKPTIVKAYVCLFICLKTKAVHLELVGDLTTAAFIACLRSFTARRGRPAQLLTDNGTNFVGAHRELEEIQRLLEEKTSSDQIDHFLVTQCIR